MAPRKQNCEQFHVTSKTKTRNLQQHDVLFWFCLNGEISRLVSVQRDQRYLEATAQGTGRILPLSEP